MFIKTRNPEGARKSGVASGQGLAEDRARPAKLRWIPRRDRKQSCCCCCSVSSRPRSPTFFLGSVSSPRHDVPYILLPKTNSTKTIALIWVRHTDSDTCGREKKDRLDARHFPKVGASPSPTNSIRISGKCDDGVRQPRHQIWDLPTVLYCKRLMHDGCRKLRQYSTVQLEYSCTPVTVQVLQDTTSNMRQSPSIGVGESESHGSHGS